MAGSGNAAAALCGRLPAPTALAKLQLLLLWNSNSVRVVTQNGPMMRPGLLWERQRMSNRQGGEGCIAEETPASAMRACVRWQALQMNQSTWATRVRMFSAERCRAERPTFRHQISARVGHSRS